jgi:hypothetical protein
LILVSSEAPGQEVIKGDFVTSWFRSNSTPMGGQWWFWDLSGGKDIDLCRKIFLTGEAQGTSIMELVLSSRGPHDEDSAPFRVPVDIDIDRDRFRR